MTLFGGDLWILKNVKSCGVDEFKTKFKNRKTHDDLVHSAHID